METTKQKVGRRVRDLRKSRGFKSAEELAAAMEMHSTSVYELERGQNWLSPEMLEKLVETLKVPPTAFFEEAGAPLPKQSRLSVLGALIVELTKLDEGELRDAATHLHALGLIDGAVDTGKPQKVGNVSR